jgi:hypothetical protein
VLSIQPPPPHFCCFTQTQKGAKCYQFVFCGDTIQYNYITPPHLTEASMQKWKATTGCPCSCSKLFVCVLFLSPDLSIIISTMTQASKWQGPTSWLPFSFWMYISGFVVMFCKTLHTVHTFHAGKLCNFKTSTLLWFVHTALGLTYNHFRSEYVYIRVGYGVRLKQQKQQQKKQTTGSQSTVRLKQTTNEKTTRIELFKHFLPPCAFQLTQTYCISPKLTSTALASRSSSYKTM